MDIASVVCHIIMSRLRFTRCFRMCWLCWWLASVDFFSFNWTQTNPCVRFWHFSDKGSRVSRRVFSMFPYRQRCQKHVSPSFSKLCPQTWRLYNTIHIVPTALHVGWRSLVWDLCTVYRPKKRNGTKTLKPLLVLDRTTGLILLCRLIILYHYNGATREMQRLPTLAQWKDVITTWLEYFALCVACKRSHEGSGQPLCFWTKLFLQCYMHLHATRLHSTKRQWSWWCFKSRLLFRAAAWWMPWAKVARVVVLKALCHLKALGLLRHALNNTWGPALLETGWNQGLANWLSG